LELALNNQFQYHGVEDNEVEDNMNKKI